MTTTASRLLTEIQEQPLCMDRILSEFPANFGGITFPGLFIQKLIGIGEGSSFNALKIAAPYIEELSGLNNFTFDPESLENKFDIAQSVRHPIKRLLQKTYFLTVSQSGETGSILNIINLIQGEFGFSDKHAPLLTFTNNPEGTLSKQYGNHFALQTGSEQSIAATKSMTASILALLLFGLRLGQKRSWLPLNRYQDFFNQLSSLPQLLAEFLQNPETHERLKEFCQPLAASNQFVLLSKGVLSSALPELGLKLTETSSNIVWTDNTESFKHGRKVILKGIKGMSPNCIYIVPPALSEQAAARFFQDIHAHFYSGAEKAFSSENVFFIAFQNSPPVPKELREALNIGPDDILTLPRAEGIRSLFLCIVAFQLLSYYLALAKGENPNNPALEKAVTH
jgi:glucosamine--fructose-6-phosphate aminotransferase (isomerizing)